MQLKKELGLLDIFCIASGAMISSGLFVLPGLAHAKAGPAVVISYVVAGLLAMAGMFSQAELVSAMPKAGGTYFYVVRSMGPGIGTIDGLLTWFSVSLKSSFALVGMAAFANLIVNFDMRLLALVFCLFFILLNLVGIKEAGRFQVAMVVVLLALLVFYVVKGLPAVQADKLRPFAPNGMGAVFSTAGFVFISYGGLIKVASIAEEVKNPARTVPLGMMLSLFVVGVLYALVVFVTTGVLDPGQLDMSLTPITDGAAVFSGQLGYVLMSVAAMLAFISTANAGIMAASRYPMALSRDHLVPGFFSRIHARFKTPYMAILATGLFMVVALFLDLAILVEVASTVLIFTFIFSCICVIIMRESGVQNYRPRFHAPLYPWLQIGGIFGCWLLVVNMGKEALFLGSVFFTCGLAVYWFYGRIRTKQDFALLHLIEKVTAREFVDVTLEQELKEIILERDDIIKDRFDRLVEEGIVLDLEGPLQVNEFFHIVASEIAAKLNIAPYPIQDLLAKREKEGSTVLAQGLAIPHIVMEGSHTFLILLARCKKGIMFPEHEEPVRTVFVIAGTRDERDFHLRALSAIAQISQDPRFGERWMSARDTEALRDIVLLGKRKRQD